MKKKIMILGASILQLPAIEKAKEMGLHVVVVDMNPQAVGFSVEGIEPEVISTIDADKVLEAARRHNIDGIMTLASDMPMRTVAVVCQELRLVGISEDTAFKATNKAAMRDALKEHGVPIPLYYRVLNKDEYIAAVNKIEEENLRCIVKPTANSGSRGIYLLKDYSFTTVDAAYQYSKEYSHSGDLMVEEYMEGPEVSVETLAINGKVYVIQITDKLTTGAPYFVEMEHSQPSQLPEKIKEEISKVAIAANHALGIKNGPSHTEIKVTRGGPKIVELGARLGGDNISTHLVPLSTGVNMVECCIKIALGEQADIELQFSKGSAIRYFRTAEGEIQAVEGVEKAKEVPGVVQVSVVHGVGERVGEIRSSVDRVGFVISQNSDAASAILSCDNALSKVHFEISK